MGIKEDITEMTETLRRERDELIVKMHLASMEVRDEWEELEKQWKQFSSSSKDFYKQVEPDLSRVHAALSTLGKDLKEGYKKIRKTL